MSNEQEYDPFDGLGIEVELPTPECFLKVRETLTRMGVTSRDKKVLYQTAHILHKKGRYALCHFKELFELDGRKADLTEDDIARRNLICKLLQDWGLVKVVDEEGIGEPIAPLSRLRILKHSEKDAFELRAKYALGKPRKNDEEG